MTAQKGGAAIDPITLSVVWNKLLSITLETGERIIHSAQSYVMGNARDLGIVLLDDNMRIITQQAFLPVHCLSAVLHRGLPNRTGSCCLSTGQLDHIRCGRIRSRQSPYPN